MNCDYEVIRLIKQNSGGHIIMDCVEGELLGEYILRCPKVPKKLFFQWISQLLEQLKCIERIQGTIDYRFLNPFFIVLKSDHTIVLLNLKAKLNQKCISKILKYLWIERFYPQNGSYSDIYSFGKTLQFLLSKAEISPELTRKETIKLQRLIHKCIHSESKKNQYRCYKDIVFYIPKNKKLP